MKTRLAISAVALSRQGWLVLPCHSPLTNGCSCANADCSSPGKHPRTRQGLHDANSDLKTVQRWWARWPNANVGLRTGAQPHGAGIVVVDIDPAHGGEESLTDLVTTNAALPPTLQVLTGGNGRHLYFRHPGVHVPNSAGRLGPGIDVRGDGGYVLAPPSLHASGRRYRWRRRALAPLPGWLLEMAVNGRETSVPTRESALTPLHRPDAWAAKAMAEELIGVRHATEGCRNHTLNRAAFALGQIVGAGLLDESDVVAQLTNAALRTGLHPREVANTIASGIQAGAASPRRPVGA